MIVTIIGAGNSGCAYACHLAAKGHRVRLLKTSHAMHEDNFCEVLRQGGLYCVDGTAGNDRFFAPLEMATRDEHDAIPGADVAFILTQSLQHEALAERIGPLLQDCRMVIVVPGYMGGLYFRRKCPNRNVLFAEGESTALDARIVEPGAVQILFRNVRNALATLPAARQDEGLGIARQLFPTYRYARRNIIESALHNPNLIVHTTGTIMSASRIEYSCGEFWMYEEAFTPSVWSLVNALDKEKNEILQAFGSKPLNYIDACKFRNEDDLSKDSLEVFRAYAKSGPKGPATLDSRYVDEDVPMGLCLMSSLGKKAGVLTPVCDALVSVAGALRQRDFRGQGRTLEKLGLGDMAIEEILSLVNQDA